MPEPPIYSLEADARPVKRARRSGAVERPTGHSSIPEVDRLVAAPEDSGSGE